MRIIAEADMRSTNGQTLHTAKVYVGRHPRIYANWVARTVPVPARYHVDQRTKRVVSTPNLQRVLDTQFGRGNATISDATTSFHTAKPTVWLSFIGLDHDAIARTLDRCGYSYTYHGFDATPYVPHFHLH